ncbi:hypothetical protein SDC9_155302 [bioreactor metagenome]|uniref:Uncharacterized protein n=1 Tax=bioreactor metagenome TaxID=1076179 RepID=A0A645F333_9ZZZZ
MVKTVAFVVETLIVGDDRSSFPGIEVFGSLETESPSQSEITDFFPFPFGKMCLAGILNDREIMLGGNLHHGIHIKWRSANMYRH